MSDFSKNYETTIPLNARPDLNDAPENIDLICMIDFAKRNRRLHEALYQLHKNGPVWDGDVISKADRTELLRIGACAKVVMKGEQGFNACTYFGSELLGIFDWLHGPLATEAAQ